MGIRSPLSPESPLRLITPIVAGLCLVVTVQQRAAAQLFDRMSNPKVTVTLNHAPTLGLAVNQIAFGPPTGRRADEVVYALQADFAASGMRVLDPRALQNTLADHQFVYSGFIDPSVAAGMGRFLGPTALLMVDVPRAAVDRSQTSTSSTDNHNVKHTTWHSKSRATVRISIQTFDLKTGQALPPQVIEKNAELENTAEEKCCAEYPPDQRVFEMALRLAVTDAHHLYLVWADPQQIYFFDDKECAMNTAHDLVKVGDLAGAEGQSTTNLERCKNTPKVDAKSLAHSYYNLGAIAFLQGRFNNARYFFEQAQKVKDIGITTDAMTLLKQAMDSWDNLRAFEAHRTDVLGAAPTAGAPSTAMPSHDSTASKLTPVQRLKALDEAYKAGLLTKEEYDKKKAEILREM